LSTHGVADIQPTNGAFYVLSPSRSEWYRDVWYDPLECCVAAGQNDRPKAHEALEQLCAAYWYPLYVFARRQGYDAAETEDLTQGFFARLLQSNDLADVSPERGRFRSFILASFKHLLASEYHRQQTQKRGGRATIVSLEREEPEAVASPEPPGQVRLSPGRQIPRPVRVFNPAVDRDLETICFKCLQKDPQRRDGSVEALADDLERRPVRL